MNISRPVLMAILFFAVILGVITYSTMTLSQHRVEICITYKGQSVCKTASATTEEFAARTATTNACAGIASGVTESMQCERTTPDKITILK